MEVKKEVFNIWCIIIVLFGIALLFLFGWYIQLDKEILSMQTILSENFENISITFQDYSEDIDELDMKIEDLSNTVHKYIEIEDTLQTELDFYYENQN